MSYNRDDPAAHLATIARDLGLAGPGIGLLTGVDVADVISETERGVRLWATVGLGTPIQAGGPATPPTPSTGDPATPPAPGDPAVPGVHQPGTVNVVAWIPARLSDGALVNAVATVTEAKTRAIRDLGLDATGTATDAVCVLCPPDGPAAAYGGPLSHWGEPLAQAAYRAVLKGGEVNLAGTQSWSERQRSA
jgi:adenosylcobinamide amidohydrolase